MCIAKSHQLIAPQPHQSGLRQYSIPILLGLTGQTLVYWICHAHLSKLWPFPTANEYCPGKEECMRSDLFAFQLTCGVMLLFLGLIGFISWSVLHRPQNKLAQTPEGRYFGITLPEADYVNAAIIVFQGWDFVASLFIEEHRTGIMLMHHTLAFVAGAGCLHYRVNPFYAVYFGGTSEFSSIFLVVVDFFKFFPPPHNSTLAKIEFAFGICFVITFFWFRVVGWIRIVCGSLIPDIRYLIANGMIEKMRPGSMWLAYYLVLISVALTGLQLFWFSQIVTAVIETLGN